MRKRILTILGTAGLLSGLVISSALAQTSDDKKMSGATEKQAMSHQETMDKMAALSTDEKAAIYDKTVNQKMPGKKSHPGMMGGMGKMSNQEKADMFDKMPMDQKMAAMNGGSGMHHGSKKIDKMDK